MSGYKADIIDNNRVNIELSIRIHDQYQPVGIKFKVDTGADRSTISQEDLLALGYDTTTVKALMKRDGGGSTADGNTADWFSIDLSLNHIMGQVIPSGLKFPFVCMSKKTVPVPKSCKTGCELTGEIHSGFKSLIGNDILSCFDISTDRQKKQMIFTRISDISERNVQYSYCEVHELTSASYNQRESLSLEAKVLLEVIKELGPVTRISVENHVSLRINIKDFDIVLK